MDNKLVSIIVPVYQAEKYIARCVASLVAQTYKTIEIIIIDDGSTDSSLKICNELAQKDSRIHVYHQKNQGVAVARNRGLDYAEGEFVYFLDSDDWIDHNALMKMVNSIEIDKADLCICGFYYTDGRYEKEHCFVGNGQLSCSDFMKGYFWNLCENSILFNIGTKLYRREKIEEINLRFCEEWIIYEDIRFCIEYIMKSEKICLQNEPYYYYFQGNASSITHVYKEGFWRSTAAYCCMLADIFEIKTIALKKAALLCLYRAYLQECYNPRLEKRNFYQLLEKYCFPIIDLLNMQSDFEYNLSIDQKTFACLIFKKRYVCLWWIAKVISFKHSMKK